MLRVSVLDQSATAAGKSHQATLQSTIALAKHCERLGYNRYWLAEHHNSPANVGTAPEILVASIASVTSRIRVGSAGVLLAHYAPFKVAESFRVLSAIAPGRIDLGIGRNPGGNPATIAALSRGAPEREHGEAVEELLHWLADDETDAATAQDESGENVRAYPRLVNGPVPWLLGTSLRSAKHAAHLGVPFCFNFSHSTNYSLSRDALDHYRAEFRPSRKFPEPVAALSVWTLAAESEEEAERLFAPRGHWCVMLNKGIRGPMIAPELAQAQSYSVSDQARIDQMREYSVVGSVSQVADRLRSICADHKIDEIVVATWTYDAADQFRSYELLADALDLKQEAPVA